MLNVIHWVEQRDKHLKKLENNNYPTGKRKKQKMYFSKNVGLGEKEI